MNKAVAHFGAFCFDLESGELRDRHGNIIPLPPQPTRALCMIVEGRGRLVQRSELREALWPSTVVDYDKGLSFCIMQIRQALGDSAERPRYVETIPKRGYRMCAEVRLEAYSEPTIHGVASRDRERHTPGPGRAGSDSATPVRLAFGVAALLTMMIAGWGWIQINGTGLFESRSVQQEVPAAPDVARLYREARYLLENGNREDIPTSRRLFSEVVQKASDFAPAWAGLATAALWDGSQGHPDVAFVRLAASRAIDLDPNQAEAHLRLGDVSARFDRNSELAQSAYERALLADPQLAEARHHYAYLLSSLGRHDEAIAQIEAAIDLEPASALLQGDAGYIYLFARQYREAMAACRRAGELIPRSRHAHECDLYASLQTKDRVGAIVAASRLLRVLGREDIGEKLQFQDSDVALQTFWAVYSSEIPKLRTSEGERALLLAYARGAMKDMDGALAALDEAVVRGAHGLAYALADPRLDPIRDDPRFSAALKAYAVLESDTRPGV